MGVFIQSIKPTKRLWDIDAQLTDEQWDSDPVAIYTLDFPPIKHLTKFPNGYWECEQPVSNAAYLSMTYSAYNRFRDAVCEPIHGDYEDYTERFYNGHEPADAPFAEFLNFADNEGSFDYPIAQKLLKDFEDYRETIYPTLNTTHQQTYDTYTRILRECVAIQGVVHYT